MSDQKPSIGRLVHFVLAAGQHRPGLVVQVWPEASYTRNECNMQVFLDGSNDFRHLDGADAELRPKSLWRTSVPQDEETKAVGTWHWQERV